MLHESSRSTFCWKFPGLRAIRTLALGIAGAGALGIASPRAVFAEQFTFFDVTFEATLQNTADAHFEVLPSKYMFTQPNNWTTPIDYTKGTVVIEHESIAKPSEEETQIDICFLTGTGYGCRNTVHYTTPGRYQTVRPVIPGFNQYAQIDWTKPITHVQFVTKDGANVNGGRDKAKFLPQKSRIAVTFVSPGGTYTLPTGWTPAPGTDGGPPLGGDAGVSDARPSDAASTDAPRPAPDAATGGAGGGSGGGAGNAGSGGDSGAGGSQAPSGGSGGASGSGGSTPSSAGSGGSSGGTGGTRPSSSGSGGATTSLPSPSPNRSSSAGGCSVNAGVDAPASQWPWLLVVGALIGRVWRRRR